MLATNNNSSVARLIHFLFSYYFRYGIRVQLYSADFKREVGRLIDEEGIKAIIMGNRRTDPWSQDL